MHAWSEAIRISKCTLKSLVMNGGAWEHRWEIWTPPAQLQRTPATETRAAGDNNPDLPRDVTREIEQLRRQVRKYQERADHVQAAENRVDRKRRELEERSNTGGSSSSGGGNGGKNGGKGGNKGGKRSDKRPDERRKDDYRGANRRERVGDARRHGGY